MTLIFCWNQKLNFSIKITGEMYHPEGVQNSSFSSSLGYMSPEYLKELILNLIKIIIIMILLMV